MENYKNVEICTAAVGGWIVSTEDGEFIYNDPTSAMTKIAEAMGFLKSDDAPVEHQPV